MNDQQLTQLQENRRLIASYAAGSGLAGLVPLPVAPDAVIAHLRTRLLEQIAVQRQIVLPPKQSEAICGLEQSSLARLALTSAVSFSLNTSWRWLTRSLLLFLRLEDAGTTLWMGTAFDWYCLRYHPGGPITPLQAAALRQAIAEAAQTAWWQTLVALFERTLKRAAELGAELPQLLHELGGQTAPAQLESAPAESTKRLPVLWHKALQLAEQELHFTERTVLEACCAAFDASWAKTTSQVSIQPVITSV